MTVGQPVETYHFCIVGAGAAGLALATKLAESGASIALIETGEGKPARDAQALNAASVVSLPYDCVESRNRALGGTLHSWAGRCSLLDPTTLAKRDWVRDSGWPVTLADLLPYYREALAFMGGPDANYFDETATATGAAPDILKDAAPSLVRKDFLILDHVDGGFAKRCIAKLRGRDNVRILSGRTVVELVPDESGAIRAVRTASTKDPSQIAIVQADTVILCMGGLETARLMLASRARQPAGVGNGHDLVGRYFTDHPRMRSSSFRLPVAQPGLPDALLQRPGVKQSQIGFRLRDDIQEQHGLLDHCFFFDRHNGDVESLANAALSHEKQDGGGKDRSAIYSFARATWRSIPSPARRMLDKTLRKRRSNKFVLTMKFECEPNPDSRILLGEERDRFGMPQLVLDWQVTRNDRENIRRYFGVLKELLTPTGLIDKELLFPDPDDDHFFQESSHPTGATRMGATAREGVVDSNLRVFDNANLFVCGSSVFPTGGNVNPTFSIVALAMRLASHLAAQHAIRPIIAGLETPVTATPEDRETEYA